jgi:hypothetical protein
MRVAHTDFEKTVSVGKKAFPSLPESVVRNAVKRMLEAGTIPQHITPSSEGWSKALDVCVQVGKLQQKDKGMQMLETRFAEKALADLPK